MPGEESVNVYVDGFNLYRRCLESHPALKWLNIVALAEHLLPEYRINRVHYFTARLTPGFSGDVRTPLRQQMYLRALATESRISIHFGTFRNDKRLMPVHPQRIDSLTGKPVLTAVRKSEEKGSDVNLATRMLADAFQVRADIYVITNDSDQVGPLTTMKDELGFRTGIIFPMPSHSGAKALINTRPEVVAHVTLEALEASQFPSTLNDAVGSFRRPQAWH